MHCIADEAGVVEEVAWGFLVDCLKVFGLEVGNSHMGQHCGFRGAGSSCRSEYQFY